MRRITLLFFLCCLLAQWSMAQAPKWLDKTKKAIFSVITYDKDDNILGNGNGFFVSTNGVALSDYSIFKGAQRAVIIDSDGKQLPVVNMMGANSMYDVVKFRVAVEKGCVALPIATTPPAVDEEILLLPYSTQKERLYKTGKVKELSKAGEEHQYYTLSMVLADNQVSCPVVNKNGEVFGMAQKASGAEAGNTCYAVGITLPMALEITGLSLGNADLRSIGIRKAFPEAEDQALVYLFMASSGGNTEEYALLLDNFITQFPNSADGYIRRATHWVNTAKDASNIERAAADLKRALEIAQNKDEVYYNSSRLMYSYVLTGLPTGKADWTMDKALIEIRLANSINPLPIYKQMEGDILFAMKDYEGAFKAYEEVSRTNMASPAVFFSAAKSKQLAGADAQEVIALMDSCIAYCPKPITATTAGYLLERAQMYMNTEQYRLALADYDTYFTALNENVNDVFYYYREQAAFYGKQFQRALNDINKAIELAPDNAGYRLELGVVNLRVGRYDEALEALDKSISLEATGDAYRLKGIALMQLKKNAEACESFAKAKELGDTLVDDLIKKNCQ